MKRVTAASPCDPTRRSFLKLCGILGLGSAATALLPVEQAEALLFGKNEYKVSETRLLMGSFVAITVIHDSRDQAQNAIGLAWEEIDRLSRILSRHDSSTPVAHLNRTGALSAAPPELLELVERSLHFQRLTNGAFDITVQPVVDLFKDRFSHGNRPTEIEISELLPLIGSEHIRSAAGAIAFDRQGMGITLDGIAPGYIVDRASALLTKNGVANHLINASGDIRTSGTTVKGAPWTVAIQDPAKGKDYPGVLNLGTGAISTSGNYEIFYDQERMFHHIVSPKTGHSPVLATSVTTVAASVMEADALATGLMVLPPEDGVRLVDTLPGRQCFVIRRDNKTTQSSGWHAVG